MKLLKLVRTWLGKRPHSTSHFYGMDADMQVTLASLAKGEGRSEQDVAAEVMAAGLDMYASSGEARERWEKLSPREQDVAALACLGYANKQIALRLTISAETVKTHMHNVLIKYGLRSRAELALLLGHWDFSAWEEVKEAHRRVRE